MKNKSLFRVTLCFLASLFLPIISLLAQDEIKIPDIPADWPLHTQYSMNKQREILITHLKAYDSKVTAFNNRCGVIPAENKALFSACQQESDALDIESGVLDKERDQFLYWFHDNEKIYAAYVASKAFLEKEQEKIDKMNAADWVKAQQDLIQNRIREPNKLCNDICNSLKKNEPSLPYKKFNELESGDVILFSPNMNEELTVDKITGKIISLTDKFTSGTKTAEASHTITYLKEENGKKLFLDNNPGQGPKILTEEAVLLKYGDRNAQVAKLSNYGVAQPLNQKEAMKLYEAAKEMEAKNITFQKEHSKNLIDNTNYGIWGGNNIVCSEASWALLKSTGRKMPDSRSTVAKAFGVSFSPSDFYENTQYFLVTPLSLEYQQKKD